MKTQISLVLLHLVGGLLLILAQGSENDSAASRNKGASINSAKVKHNLFDYGNCLEVQQLCHHIESNDVLSVLECISSLQPNQLKSLSPTCQHLIWQNTKRVHTTKFLTDLLKHSCEVQLGALPFCEKADHVLSCLLNKVEYSEADICSSIIRKIRVVIFPHFDERREFFLACDSEVPQFQCGRLDLEHSKIPQLETVACLQTKDTNALSASCLNAINKIQRQQEEIAFLEACNPDIHRLCPQEQADANDAIECLLNQKTNAMLSTRCSKKIMQPDNEIVRDYQAIHSLSKACNDDIKKHHCRRGVSDYKQVRLAQILLCLESAVKHCTQLAVECRDEIDDHRKMLMMDFQFSPEILSDCSEEVSKFCSNVEEVRYCLMFLKRKKDKRMTVQCQRSLENLPKTTDVGEDWRVDPVLKRACKSVVDVACSETVGGGEARVMSCLMERIESHLMEPSCEYELLLIQYFVARDFKLDPQLYKHCRDDVIKFCHAKKFWDDANDKQMDPERDPLIFPCLHRIAYSDDGNISLHEKCHQEVKRVMRQRAISVNLIPEVEDVCIEDLSQFCNNKIERGAEMDCLQSNMEELQFSCKVAMTNYTEEEPAHVELNPIIMSVCMQAMKTYCEYIMNGGNGDMMDCLISHKNDADLRQDLNCRVAIEHFQALAT